MPDDEPLTGPTDIAAPWTIKSVATETRRAVTDAARREGLTVGQWLEKRVREWMEAGSPVPVTVTLPVASPEAKAQLVQRVVETAIALGGSAGVSPAFRRRAERALKDMLPRPAPWTKAPALPAPDA